VGRSILPVLSLKWEKEKEIFRVAKEVLHNSYSLTLNLQSKRNVTPAMLLLQPQCLWQN
jgi:hypothetical protein